MSNLSSPIGTANSAIPIVNQTQLGQAAGLFVYFPSFSAFTSAITNERANVIAGNPIWANGQPMSIASEPTGVIRIWSTSLNHARTVILSDTTSVILTYDNNTIYSNIGLPSSVIGNTGDVSIDITSNVYYLKSASAWSTPTILNINNRTGQWINRPYANISPMYSQYFATDVGTNGALFYCDGVDWRPVGGSCNAIAWHGEAAISVGGSAYPGTEILVAPTILPGLCPPNGRFEISVQFANLWLTSGTAVLNYIIFVKTASASSSKLGICSGTLTVSSTVESSKTGYRLSAAIEFLDNANMCVVSGDSGVSNRTSFIPAAGYVDASAPLEISVNTYITGTNPGNMLGSVVAVDVRMVG